jgi:chromosome segregation ATPase
MPYENEHACRLEDPGKFQDNSFRRGKREHNGKEYSVIYGKLKGKTTTTEQAYRYNKNTWTADEARKHCKDHGGSFEAAKNEKEGSVMGGKTMDELQTEIVELNSKVTSLTESGAKKDGQITQLTQERDQLKSEKDSLEGKVKDLTEQNKKLDKDYTLLLEKYDTEHEKAVAEGIMDSVLSDSSIHEKMHVKVRNQVDYKSFIVDNEKFTAESKGAKAFEEAFMKEVKDWEENLPKGGGLGLEDEKGTKTDELPAETKEENAGIVSEAFQVPSK